MYLSPKRPLLLLSKLLTPAKRFLCGMASPSQTRSYNDAIDALNTLQTPHDVIEARRKAGIRPDATSIKEMLGYLSRIGYTPKDLNRLNVVHVAGTKGKGSTCAYVDSILSRYRVSRGKPVKSGLFISPHLIAVRERIRINSAPISEELFARYFFDVWDRLGNTAAAAPCGAEAGAGAGTVDLGHGGDDARPSYARFLTLMSWHVFLQESVDVAVYETGIGGEFDATNIVEKPLASGISTLGIDHIFALGNTVDKIAWHKAGIMKTGSPAFTVQQLPEAAQALKDRAAEKQVDLKVLDIDPRLDRVRIRPDASFQKKNASLGIALAETALRKLGILEDGRRHNSSRLPREFVDGLEGVVFRGRCEIKTEEKVMWYVDGAHTADSLKVSAEWFASEISNQPGPRVMIFNQQGRTEAVEFLRSIQTTLQWSTKPAFDHVVFCTNVTYAKTGYKRDFVNNQFDPKDIEGLTVQKAFQQKWRELDPKAEVIVLPTIEEAINYAQSIGKDLPGAERAQVFVTGSLHLVGGALGILEKADAL